MILKTKLEDLPPELVGPLKMTDLIVRSYLACLTFIIDDTARDPAYARNHLLSCLAQDYAQSTVAVLSLAMEGLVNVCKRELRFLVESSVKICFVQQKNYRASIAEKLDRFEKQLNSPSSSIKRDLDLSMLPAGSRDAFGEEVGRIYGLTSTYVHLTPAQIEERVRALAEGRTAGKEGAAAMEALNGVIARALSCSLVLLLHAVPDYVAGEWFVEANGDTVDWHLMGARFLADMDAHFDYKHERQDRLAEIRAARLARIAF